MTDSHDKQQKLQAVPEGVDAICDVFKPVWLAGQEQEVATLEYATARAPQAWFSPNGNNLFVYSNQTLQVYEAPSFAEIERADASQELVGERP